MNPYLNICLTLLFVICLCVVVCVNRKKISKWCKQHPKRLRDYQKRHQEALALVDESIVDIIKATEIIMSGESQSVIDNVVYESIEKNYIIQRAFSEKRVIYTKEVSRKWIIERTEKIKAAWSK